MLWSMLRGRRIMARFITRAASIVYRLSFLLSGRRSLRAWAGGLTNFTSLQVSFVASFPVGID